MSKLNLSQQQQSQVFSAIVEFIRDLDAEFNNKYKSVALYNRLLKATTVSHQNAVQRHIEAFSIFFKNNPEYISHKKLGTENTVIFYSKNVYIDMKNILNKIADDNHEVIHQHLTTIFTLININNELGLKALETLKGAGTRKGSNPGAEWASNINIPDTNEGQFMKDMLLKMADVMPNTAEMEQNPMVGIANMAQSGFFTDFITNVATKVQNKELDVQKLLLTAVNTVIMPQTGAAGGSGEASTIGASTSESSTSASATNGASKGPKSEDID